MWSQHQQTLVGIATGTTDGGVAIIRLSGNDAIRIAEALGGKVGPERTIVLRKLKREGGEVVDEGLMLWMGGPRSFTGEDVVEFYVHAGQRNVGQIVDRLLDLGACAAGPGEFSRRAVANGRMSLEEAEGVAAMIGAKNEVELAAARRLMAGELGVEVDGVRERVQNLRVEIEANLDFPDAVESSAMTRWVDELESISRTLGSWLAGFEESRFRRQKRKIVIVGPPNVGKSALFNCLLREKRALVSNRAGTTRDYLEMDVDLGGGEVKLIDTAGLREESDDEIEREGIGYSLDQLAGAQLVLWVESIDQSGESIDSHCALELDRERTIYVENKRDLGAGRDDWVGVSAETGEGIDGLRQLIADRIAELEAEDVPTWIGLARHRDCAAGAMGAIRNAIGELEKENLLELVAFSLAQADLRLGEIRGRSGLGPVGQEVLNEIFSSFCIGK